jgi:hypothetical protein
VEVRAGGAKRGTTYMLKKGPLRWEVISRRFWQSVSVTLRPNKLASITDSREPERRTNRLHRTPGSHLGWQSNIIGPFHNCHS